MSGSSAQGRPNPAFLNNVPTAITSTISPSTTSSSTSSSSTSSSSITTASTTSRTSTSTSTSLANSATATTPSSHPEPTSIYFYSPSVPITIVFSVLYFALIPYHFYLSIFLPHIRRSVHQKHTYTIPLFIAAVLSTLGFSLRIFSVSSESSRSSISLYASSQTWIIVAPIFVCATLYLLIAHLIKLCLPEGRERAFLGISPRWLGRAFVTSDVLSFLCQGAGSAIAASGNWQGPSKDVGTNILILGLAAQLFTFTIYMIVLGLFCKRVSSGHTDSRNNSAEMAANDGGIFTAPTTTSANEKSREFGFNPLHKQVVKGMWIASILVEIRSIHRTIEFSMGVEGYLFQHEWPLWVFEAVPMWLALLVLGIYHPAKWLQQKRRSAFLDKSDRRVAQAGGVDLGLPK